MCLAYKWHEETQRERMYSLMLIVSPLEELIPTCTHVKQVLRFTVTSSEKPHQNKTSPGSASIR